MSYTNMTINLCHDHIEKIVHDLKCEKEYWENLANRYHDQLRNIPKAVNEHGYVDIDGDAYGKMRLVKDKEQK